MNAGHVNVQVFQKKMSPNCRKKLIIDWIHCPEGLVFHAAATTDSPVDAAPQISSRSDQRATGDKKLAAMRRARAYDSSARATAAVRNFQGATEY